MEPQESGNNAEQSASIGTTEHHLFEEKELLGQKSHLVPDGVPENGSAKPDETGEVGISHEQGKERSGQEVRIAPDEIPETDKVAASAEVTGKENRNNVSAQKKPVIAHPATEVRRKTELEGMSTKPCPEDSAQIRRRTERDLKNPDFGIPYAATEKAVRDLVCSLMERQDRMNADIFLEINSMQEDIGMLKDLVYKLRTTKGGTAAGEKK